MYGYAFGAAKSGVWHRWGEDFMLYPGYTPPGAGRGGGGRWRWLRGWLLLAWARRAGLRVGASWARNVHPR
jgi:hypothetical protein